MLLQVESLLEGDSNDSIGVPPDKDTVFIFSCGMLFVDTISAPTTLLKKWTASKQSNVVYFIVADLWAEMTLS